MEQSGEYARGAQEPRYCDLQVQSENIVHLLLTTPVQGPGVRGGGDGGGRGPQLGGGVQPLERGLGQPRQGDERGQRVVLRLPG